MAQILKANPKIPINPKAVAAPLYPHFGIELSKGTEIVDWLDGIITFTSMFLLLISKYIPQII